MSMNNRWMRQAHYKLRELQFFVSGRELCGHQIVPSNQRKPITHLYIVRSITILVAISLYFLPFPASRSPDVGACPPVRGRSKRSSGRGSVDRTSSGRGSGVRG